MWNILKTNSKKSSENEDTLAQAGKWVLSDCLLSQASILQGGVGT